MPLCLVLTLYMARTTSNTVNTNFANDFISSPSFRIRLRKAVSVAWEIFGRKVGGGLIPVNKEASMQLQYAYVLKQLLPMILMHPSEKVEVELETGVRLKGVSSRNNIDILVKGDSDKGEFKIAIELKCYRNIASSTKDRGATNNFMRDMYVDLDVLERYVEQGIADAGVALVMNDLHRLVRPKTKTGWCWTAHDISHGFVFPGGKIPYTTSGPYDVDLKKRYEFQWSEYGDIWFAELEGAELAEPLDQGKNGT